MRIPIQSAYICQDCSCIVDSGIRCDCGSEHGLQSISAILDRPEMATDIRVGKLLKQMDDVLDPHSDAGEENGRL